MNHGTVLQEFMTNDQANAAQSGAANLIHPGEPSTVSQHGVILGVLPFLADFMVSNKALVCECQVGRLNHSTVENQWKLITLFCTH